MQKSSPEARNRLKALMLRLREGDRAAFAPIYDATRVKLFGICLRILKDRQAAEDALQDVYANLWRGASRYDPDRASPISWLATFARNRAIDRLRRQGSRGTAVPVDEAFELPDGEPLAEEQMIDAEQRARVHGCIETLAERDRQPIRAAFFDGRSYTSLAEEADLPLGTMKSRIRRALIRLRTCLEDDA